MFPAIPKNADNFMALKFYESKKGKKLNFSRILTHFSLLLCVVLPRNFNGIFSEPEPLHISKKNTNNIFLKMLFSEDLYRTNAMSKTLADSEIITYKIYIIFKYFLKFQTKHLQLHYFKCSKMSLTVDCYSGRHEYFDKEVVMRFR